MRVTTTCISPGFTSKVGCAYQCLGSCLWVFSHTSSHLAVIGRIPSILGGILLQLMMSSCVMVTRCTILNGCSWRSANVIT